jgi:hypothetical protein
MFYKDRSTVLGRIGPKSQHPATPDAKDDTILDMADALVEAGQQRQAAKDTKLSPFERELLQAWAD